MTEIIRNIDEDKVLEMANKIISAVGELIEKNEMPEECTPMELKLAALVGMEKLTDSFQGLPAAIRLEELKESYLLFVQQYTKSDDVECDNCFGYGRIENPDVWSTVAEIDCPKCNGAGHTAKHNEKRVK